MDLTIEKIFNLFFKFPIRYIPIVSGETVFSFISKAKTLREASNPSIFEQDLNNLLKNIFENIDANIFFTNIDELNIEKIPIINFEDLSIKVLTISQFNSMFRPLAKISDEQMRQIVDELVLAFFILNSRNQMIYQNKLAIKLHKSLVKETGMRKKSLIDFLPQSFYQNIENKTPEKIYAFKIRDRELNYRIQSMIINKGVVNLVYFLN